MCFLVYNPKANMQVHKSIHNGALHIGVLKLVSLIITHFYIFNLCIP